MSAASTMVRSPSRPSRVPDRALVTPAIDRLRKRHSGLGVRILDAEPDESLAALRAGEVDVAVIYQYGFAPPVAPDLFLTLLREDEMRLCPPGGRGRRGGSQVQLGDLEATPFVAGRSGSQCHAFTNAACARAGFAADIAFETDDIAFTCALVDAGLAAAIMASTLLETAPTTVHTVTALPALPPRKIFAACRPATAGREPVEAALRELQARA